MVNIYKFKKAVSSECPFNSLFQLIPDNKKKEFLEFAKKFGMTEEKLKEVLAKEKDHEK